MKYIVKAIIDLIVSNAPLKENEMMIRVDGFEDIRIYEMLSREVSNILEDRGLSVRIKLAKSKWRYFKSVEKNSIYLQFMEQAHLIAEAESITYYRNQHDTNVLILLGTENEEDKGGLLNCYSITPNTLVDNLAGRYYDMFLGALDFEQPMIDVVNKLYADLFEFTAIDICKLSDIMDRWMDKIAEIDDFIEFFYASLPMWGLPLKEMDLPLVKDLKSKNNVLRVEHNFITRQLFKKLSKTQYNKYKEQIALYEQEQHKYSSEWLGWSTQAISGYSELSEILLSYIRGERIEKYKEKLIRTDFSIIEAILDMKISREKKVRNTTPIVLGEPLEAFSQALLQMLSIVKELNVEVELFEFHILQAEIVSMYSDVDDEEEMQQLQNTWITVCRHTNGVFNYLNRNMWFVNDNELEISCTPEEIFHPNCSLVNIDSGYVKAAASNKTISKIDFNIVCRDSNGDAINVGKRNLVQSFQWKFSGGDEWLHNFSDICSLKEFEYTDNAYIPIATINKLDTLIFAKSEEEFFDLYDENDIRFDYNLIEYLNKKITTNTEIICANFQKIGRLFVKLIYEIANDGFYSCICKEQSVLSILVDEYTKLGVNLSKSSLPENQKWLLDAFIHAFNIEETTKVIHDDVSCRCCIVPAWHPAALEKLNDQKIFFLDGCAEWWNSQDKTGRIAKKEIEETIESLMQMSMIQSAVDIFPSYGQQYYGAINSFGTFSIYGRNDIENNSRLKDMIHKDAIYDDDFDSKENTKMSDDAKMLYTVLGDYMKAFPNSYSNLSIVFIDPSELQPIIASIYKYIEVVKNKHPEHKININIKILVKPENKGGRNYLSYWMDECFSQDANVSIKTYLNEWSSTSDIDKLLNGNNDIVFVMDLLKVNNLQFIKESGAVDLDLSQCRFPIVFKPTPVSDTSSNVKRGIELSQPQFRGAYAHTQVARYRNRSESIPDNNYIAVKEVCIDSNAQNLVYSLHEKAYWVVCVDSGMDGALLRNDEQHKNEYSIIGFSTGKGSYGQYNLTITARKSILDIIQKKLEARLYQLFHWEQEEIDKATKLCLKESSGLDGISLLSAINQKDRNINEFMAYVLTSRREKELGVNSALKIIVHLDSYKHWFTGEIQKDDDESQSRPDFLVLEARISNTEKLQLNATVTECKIACVGNALQHKEKATKQVEHGIKRLSTIFDPNSKSIKRRYWYAQLYRALAFAQITFSDNSCEFEELSSKLRSVLDGNFDIKWNGKILGYWLDMNGEEEEISITDISAVQICDIPQKRIQQLLLNEKISGMKYIDIDDNEEETQEEIIGEREQELQEELKKSHKMAKLEVDFKSRQNELQPYLNDTITPNSDLSRTEEVDVHHEVKKVEDIIITEDTVEEDVKEYSSDTNGTEEVPVLSDLSLHQTRVLIGKDRVSNTVSWEFGHKQLANRHLLITGTSGQGKTYSIQTMLYELSKSKISSVIFDYTEGFRLDQLEKEFVERMENHINQRVVKFENVPINPFKRQFIEYAGSKFPEKDADIAQRFATIMTHVYKFGEQQSSAIFEAARIGLSKYNDGMNMQYFKEELENVKQDNRAAQTVISKMQPFFYSIDFEDDSTFDWGDIVYPEEATATIFQLTAIDRDMQVIITELMLWDLWYYSMKNGNKEKPFVTVLDEAQNLSHKEKSPSCKILTEGRKFGWSAWYATQSLKVLQDEEVTRLLQSAFKLYFKPTDDEIVKMSKQLDPSDGGTWINALKGLKKGQCITIGDRMKKDGIFGQVKPTITNVVSFKERD